MAQHRQQVDELLERVFGQAPLTLHYVFALDGANEAMASMKTAESKVAYLIQMIAIQLHKASKEISSTKLSDGPNDLRFHLIRTHPFFASTPFTMTVLNLAEFEDVYYATCAKLKELLSRVDLLLVNGFKLPGDTYFEYRHHERLNGLGPISISDFRTSLHTYECILYSSEVTELLNKAVMKKGMHDDKCNSQMQMSQGHRKADNYVERTHTTRWDGSRQTEEHKQRHHEGSEQDCGRWPAVRGLQEINNMGCSMIFGSLAEKYRPVVLNIELEGGLIDREPTPDAPQVSHEEQFNPAYVSPYNLDERAKKLNVPGGPDMPCLCDPECICAPVCASDPTQNCLCEENGLFTCVTQGMDIDDLDVPDLIRRKRQGSQTSGSSAASPITSTNPVANWQIRATHHVAAEGHFGTYYGDMGEMEQQKQVQQSMATDEANFEDVTSMSGIILSLEVDKDRFWQGQSLKLSQVPSLAYRTALTQPFAKQCEFPPKRSSMTRRLFNSRNGGLTYNKKSTTLMQIATGYGASDLTRKPLKQTTKRSLAGLSFTGLELALRRNPQVHGQIMGNQTTH